MNLNIKTKSSTEQKKQEDEKIEMKPQKQQKNDAWSMGANIIDLNLKEQMQVPVDPDAPQFLQRKNYQEPNRCMPLS